MRYISFKSSLLSALNDVGTAILAKGKVWLLWLNAIKYILKSDEDRYNIFRECLKHNVNKEDIDLIKREYREMLDARKIQGDELLNYALLSCEGDSIEKPNSQNSGFLGDDDINSNVAEAHTAYHDVSQPHDMNILKPENKSISQDAIQTSASKRVTRSTTKESQAPDPDKIVEEEASSKKNTRKRKNDDLDKYEERFASPNKDPNLKRVLKGSAKEQAETQETIKVDLEISEKKHKSLPSNESQAAQDDALGSGLKYSIIKVKGRSGE
jgi:hypothetical protein